MYYRYLDSNVFYYVGSDYVYHNHKDHMCKYDYSKCYTIDEKYKPVSFNDLPINNY